MKRIISILLAISLFIPLAAHAATWITVSSWAYNSVSNFKNAGLLPESFDNVTDYTQEITRIQFAELVHSVLTKSKCINYSGVYYDFNDTTSNAARTLALEDIMGGDEADIKAVPTGRGTMLETVYSFHPDRLLTREEMARVVYNAARKYCAYLFKKESGYYTLPTDFYISSDWAQESIRNLYDKSLLAGSDNGYFRPKANLTIEQAVSVLYRLYNTIPTVCGSDGASTAAQIEMWLQTYDNGITETRLDDVLYLKDGFDILMGFETDIYTNVFCATHDGIIYAAAQNIHGRGDVYNTETKELLYTIPYPIYSAEEDYIITKSQTGNSFTFGVYGYDNTELLPPEYSLNEINTIKANGFKIPEETKTEASGWIYYVNPDDSNSLYKLDSNGENKQKLADHRCDDIKYIDGRIYFEDMSTGETYSIKTDGTDKQLLGRNINFIANNFSEYNYGEKFSGTVHKRDIYRSDGWIYYSSFSDNSNITELYRIKFTGADTVIEKITDKMDVSLIQVYQNNIYFLDYSTVEDIYKSDSCSLYRYDGKNIIKVHDNVCDYCFDDGALVMSIGENEDSADIYSADTDGKNARLISEGEPDAEQRTASSGGISYRYVNENLSDESYTVVTEGTHYGSKMKLSTVVYTADGYMRAVSEDYVPFKRIGDTLYFLADSSMLDSEIARNIEIKGMDDVNTKHSSIIAYNLRTGRKTTVANNAMSVYSYENADGEDWFTYTNYTGNIWRYNASANALSEIFPNKGIRQYGEMQCAVQINGCLYKADKQGNYSFLTDTPAAYLVYVAKNSPQDAVYEAY